MLFDLRGRGRRRTIQAIYLGLALLIGLGLVGFGVGGGLGGGGIFNALEKNEGGGTSFASQIKAAQKRTTRRPNDPAGWAALAEAQLHEASNSPYYEQTSELVAGKYTAQGKELLHQIANDWNRYLALVKGTPSTKLANEMAREVFTEEGLNEPAEVVKALQILIGAKPPSEALFASLAEAAYKAKNIRQGDLASAKALSLAPKSGRAQLKTALESVKKSAASPTGTSSSAPSTVVTATASTASAPASATKTKSSGK